MGSVKLPSQIVHGSSVTSVYFSSTPFSNVREMRLLNVKKKLKFNLIMRISNKESLSDFLGGGYKNAVGGRVVELFERCTYVLIECSSLNSFESL